MGGLHNGFHFIYRKVGSVGEVVGTNFYEVYPLVYMFAHCGCAIFHPFHDAVLTVYQVLMYVHHAVNLSALGGKDRSRCKNAWS